MSDWRKINQLCLRITDGSHFSPVGVESGYPMLSVKDMQENGFDYSNCKYINETDYISLVKNDCKPLKNDVLIAKDGSYLKHVFVIKDEREEAILSSIGILRPNLQLVDPFYLKYYLDSDFVKQEVAKKYVSGSALPRIILKNFGEILVPYIEKSKQTKIVNILKSIDSKIALNNRINAELEAMAKMVYDYWFVQFDFPNVEGKPYKSLGGKMVWSEELKRKVPEGWEVGTLTDITNITTGKLDSNAEVLNGDYPFYTCAAEPTRTDAYAFDDTVILIAGNNASGNFHINRYKGKFNAYQRTYIVTANDPIDLEYIYQVLNVETKLLKTQGKGSQTKFLTIGMLTGIKTIRNRNVMKLFHEKVSPMYEQQEILKKENQHLSSLRDWLLPMLMNGQVSVGTPGYAAKKEEGLMAAEGQIEYRGLK